MSQPCLIHPENACEPVDGQCTCAPRGMAHDDLCGTRRGHKCNCAIAALLPDTAIGMAAFLMRSE